jgi:glycosidase
MEKIPVVLTKLECTAPFRPERGGKETVFRAAGRRVVMEFHVNRGIRDKYGLDQGLFSLTGNVVLADLRQVRELTAKFNAGVDPRYPDRYIKAGNLYAMGLIDEILHHVVALYREQVRSDAFETALLRLEKNLGSPGTGDLLSGFAEQFPPRRVYAGETTVDAYLASSEDGESCRCLSLEETMLLALANLNPAFTSFKFLFDDADLAKKTLYPRAMEELRAHFAELPAFGPDGLNLWDMLRAPALASPDSLAGQLDYMRRHWGLLISRFMSRLLVGLDVIKEENRPGFGGGPGPMEALTYGGLDEYERFSPDKDWMPRTVLMAKSTLVWLFQLSQKYGREITRLDGIPDEELDELARRGFTGLWLIGLWERSSASKTIKQWTGNPEAAASAYSLYDYDIAGELGGWGALTNLRERCFRRGIRLGSDMVPNHTGIDSRWVMEHPDRFLQLSWPPFPGYSYNCGNLSGRDDITVQIEEHYFTRTDAAVVFKRTDNHTGQVRYIYHGNDGTSMPWNDTAQIDFLNPEAREAVIRTIVGVCRQFSIVRFDAAMTLAKRHIQRLWYPEPGRGGDIASRAEHAISGDEFNRRIPNEFWREVVDRCAEEAPNTLLLAEAFWMMEGYFVRTLGMHRVYNSAFMNMLKNEDNAKYRATIKNTLEFDPEILKRFVNFMNNPDEETAVAQFGKGDKYFGICTLLVTMPGLPMFGHGQIEGFEEKYGMEYRRSYRDEKPDQYLVDRHEREIFPLMQKRSLFSGSAGFRLFDLYTPGGQVNENVFAYTNRLWDEKALVFYNNSLYESSGWIRQSSPAIPQGDGGSRQDSLGEALSLHGEDRFFALFREQRQGFWFIRSSKEMGEKGFFVSLRGYEAQVYLDIHEVEDANGRWARLNHDLNGKGVRDLEAAIQDIFLGELYYRFTGIFRPESIEALYRLFTVEGRDNPAASGACIEGLKESARLFIAGAKRYVGGAGGQYDPFSTGFVHPAVDDDRILEEFEGFLKRLLELPCYAGQAAGKAAAGTGAVKVKGAVPAPAARYLGGLAGRIREKPAIAAFALGYGVFSLCRLIIGEGAGGADASALAFGHWRLDRKLREAYRELGIDEDEAGRVVELMKAALARTVPADTGPYKDGIKKAGLLGAAIILENYEAGDFRRALGVNRFEEITWFNKEGFEESLFYGSLFFSLESSGAFEPLRRPETKDRAEPGGTGPAAADEKTGPAAAAAAGITAPVKGVGPLSWSDRVGIIAELGKVLTSAEEASGYRLDGLIETLTGVQAGAAGTVKKGRPARTGGTKNRPR